MVFAVMLAVGLSLRVVVFQRSSGLEPAYVLSRALCVGWYIPSQVSESLYCEHVLSIETVFLRHTPPTPSSMMM